MVRAAGRRIVNVGSMWAVDAIASTPTSAYSAAQAGRHSLTKNLAVELAPHGIRVNTVALAFVETPAYERFMTPEVAREVLDGVAASTARPPWRAVGRGRGHPLPGQRPARPGSRARRSIDGGVLAGRNAPPAAAPAEAAEPAAA